MNPTPTPQDNDPTNTIPSPQEIEVSITINGLPALHFHTTGTPPQIKPLPKNGYAFRPDLPNRITLQTPGHDDHGYPRPITHGLDHKTALNLLLELASSIPLISPPNPPSH